jgi:tRNA(fMet)-specific endonuclease VapC
LDNNGTVRIVASVVSYAELAVGFETRASLDERLLGIPLLTIDVGCAWIAGRIARKLRREGRMIGANDIWIAATAVQAGLPVLTRNKEEFARVAGLSVISY